MAKKKTAGSGTTPTPSTPAAPAKRRAAPRGKTGDAPTETPSAVQSASGAAQTADVAADRGVSGAMVADADAPGMGAAAVTGAPTESAAPYAPSFEQIAEEAYHRYLSRGGVHGADFEDWLEAERQLRQRNNP